MSCCCGSGGSDCRSCSWRTSLPLAILDGAVACCLLCQPLRCLPPLATAGAVPPPPLLLQLGGARNCRSDGSVDIVCINMDPRASCVAGSAADGHRS